MKVGIAGVGGIGSNAAAHLVRGGIRHLKLVDHDRVEETNLNRQFYFQDQIGGKKVDMLAANLRRIDPGSIIETHHVRLHPENMAHMFNDCDAVVEGLDTGTDKKHLLEALADSGKLVASACGVAGLKPSGLRTRRIGRCWIIGDFQTDAARLPVYGPKIAIVAAWIAAIILEAKNDYD